MKYLVILFMFVSLTGYAQKKLLRQASELEISEQHVLASEKYREVLYKNARNMEALAGLKRTSQKVVDDKLSAYFINRNSGETEAAVRTFDDILHYREELKYFNVSINIPSYYYTDYEEDKKQLANHQEAKKDEILDEQYLEAVSLFEQAKWIDAWKIFSAIRSYKEASSYLIKIESKAIRISIAENNKNRLSSEDVMRSKLQSEIFKLNNPLIRIISRDNLDQVIEEQKLGLSGLFDEQTVAELGKLLGVDMMLLTRVLNVYVEEPVISTQNKTAYISSSQQVYDPVTQTTNSKLDYFPVTYQEHITQGRSEISFQYQLINVTTAEVLTAEVINESEAINFTSGTYNGDPNTLYPSNGTSIFTKGKERDAFLALFSKNQRTPSKRELEIKLQRTLAKRVAESLDHYFRNR